MMTMIEMAKWVNPTRFGLPYILACKVRVKLAHPIVQNDFIFMALPTLRVGLRAHRLAHIWD